MSTTPFITSVQADKKIQDSYFSLEQQIDIANAGSDLGLLKLTDTPPPTGKHRGDVQIAGTYTNFDGIVFTQLELDNNYGFIYVDEGVSTKVLSGKKDADTSIINVTENYPLTIGNYYTSENARLAVPVLLRNNGRIITYALAEDVWVLEQFSKNFETISEPAWILDVNWKKVTFDRDSQIINVSNFSKNYALTSNSAKELVPINSRKQGLMITYATADKKWILEQYNRSTFNSVTWLVSENWTVIDMAKVIDVSQSLVQIQKYMPTAPSIDIGIDSRIDSSRIDASGNILTNISSFSRTGKKSVFPGTVSVTSRMSSNGYIALYKKDGSLSRTIDPGALGVKTITIDINYPEYYIDVSFAPSGATQSASIFQTTVDPQFSFERADPNAKEPYNDYISALSKSSSKFGINLVSGTFGENDAVYKLEVDCEDFHVVTDFHITENMNEGDELKEIFRIEGSANVPVYLSKKSPVPLFSSFFSADPSYQQQIEYKSGFRINTNTIPRHTLHYKPLIGEDVFSVWLKGNFSVDALATEAELNTRSSYLEMYQDLSIVFQNDEIKLVRDGVSSVNTPFNSGTVSEIFSLSIKIGVDYKALSVLFEELKTLCLANDIDINFMDLSARKTSADLFQFGKIKLVGYYNIQQNPLNTTLSYQYDSFPVNFTFKIDETKHVIECLKSGDKLYVSVDGWTREITLAGRVSSIYFGGISSNNGAVFSNLELNRNSHGNCERIFVSTSTTNPSLGANLVISERNPYMLGLMGHETLDGYEGQVPPSNTQQQSSTRVEDTIIALKRKGYSIVSMDDFIKMYTGKIPFNKRTAVFIYDDFRIADSYELLKARNHISKQGGVINYATINTFYEENDANYKLFTSMRSNGFSCISHSYSHDVMLARKNSLVLHYQLKLMLMDNEKKNWVNNALVYNERGQWENTYQMLKNNGILIAFSNVGTYSSLETNPYDLHRLNIGDNGSYNIFNAIV